MLLVYYRFYITYTLAGFLFDLDSANVCRDIQKIDSFGKVMLTNSTEIIQHYKKAENTSEEVEKYFPGLYGFHRLYRTTDSKTLIDKDRRKMYYSLGKKEKTYYCKEPVYG